MEVSFPRWDQVGISVDDTNLTALTEKSEAAVLKHIQKGILNQIGPKLIINAFLNDTPESRKWRITILNDYGKNESSILKTVYNYIGWNSLSKEEIDILESEDFLKNLPQNPRYNVVLQIPEVKESSFSMAKEHLKRFEDLFRTAIKENVFVPHGLISGRLEVASEHTHINVQQGVRLLQLTNPSMTTVQEDSLYDVLKEFFTKLDKTERKFVKFYTLQKNLRDKKIEHDPSALLAKTRLLKDKDTIEKSLTLLSHKKSDEFSHKILHLLAMKTRLKGKSSLLDYAKGISAQCAEETIDTKFYLKRCETEQIYSPECEMDRLKAKVEQNFRIFMNHLVSVYPFFIDQEVFDILGIQKPDKFDEIAWRKIKLIEPNLRMTANENS